MNQESLNYWLLAIRPKTLSITLAPILCASVFAYTEYGGFNGWILFCILISALSIQIGTNLYNDAADFERGADQSDRLGPDRVTAKGWLAAATVKKGAFVSFTLAFFSGIYLAYIGGLPIIVLGLISILCGYAYTGGPKPIAYSPLGELFVIVFFGLFAVAGSFYLLTQSFNSETLWIGLSLGSFAAAILLVNNYRDLDNDIRANKITLAYYLGRSHARQLYAAMLIGPFIIVGLQGLLVPHNSPFLLLTLLILPYAIFLIKTLNHTPISRELNSVLAKTAKLQLLFSLLFCVGLLI